MPIFNEEDLLNATRSGIAPEEPVEPAEEPVDKPGFLDAAAAFFKLENPVFNATKELFAPTVDKTYDPNFNSIEKLQKERPDLADFATNFADVRNEEEYNRTLLNVEYEMEQRETFQKAPTWAKLAGGLAAGLTDPLILVPYVGIAKTVNTLKRIGTGVGIGLGAGAAAAGVREGILQASQETRTIEESMINITAETVLGGILGGGVAALSNPVKAASRKVLSKALAGEDFKIKISPDGTAKIEQDSLSAAATNSELENLGLAHINETLTKVVSGPEGLRAPDLRAILSPSETTRKLGEVFYNSNYIRNKHLEGVASGPKAQNAIFRAEQNTHLKLKQVDDLYTDYTGRGILGSTIARPKNLVSHLDFSKRIWRNLTDDTRVDEIAQVNKAAKLLRKDLDEMAVKLQQAKLLPEDIDPKFMANYMTRIYKQNKLASPASQTRFLNKVKGWVKVHNKDASPRVNPLADDEAGEIAQDILDAIRGEKPEQVALSGITEGFVSKGKFLKQRQLLIPDSEIAEFLEQDSLRLFKNYMARTSKLLETHKALNRAGYESIQDAITQIRSEAALATRGLDEAEAVKVGNKFKEQEKLTNMMYRSMLGQMRKPGGADRFAEGLLNYQFVRLLGGVTVSSLPEMAMAPFRFGFLNTLRDGYLPMIQSFKTAKLAKNQLNDLSGALEFEQANVLRALGGIDDIEDVGRANTTFDKVQNLLTKGFIKASGIGHYTSMGRRVSSQIAAADIIRTLKAGKDVEKLAAVGIGKKDYSKVLKQIDDHVQKYKGTFVVNPHLWKDKEALELMQNAIQTHVESTILKPGVESLPFFVQQSMMAKVVFQFKSFMSAATGKVLISGLQRRDAAALNGMISLIAMGTLTQMAHDKITGRESSDDPAELLLDGVSRSGLLGLLPTAVLDTGLAFYSEKSRRFGGKFVSSQILGPSAGQVEEIVRATQGMVDGNITDKDTKAALRMVPFMNLFYIKALTERALGENK